MESRFYDALTAKAYCDSGKFVLYGRRLRPFCMMHSVQLDALQSSIWLNGIAENESDLQLAAIICSSSEPVVDFSTDGMAEQSFAEAFEVWVKYMSVSASRPKIKQRAGDNLGTALRAPTELLIITYLARKMHMNPADLWTMPVGMVHWYLESCREQEDGDSWILTEEEEAFEAKMQTDEGRKEWADFEATNRRIVETVRDHEKMTELLGLNAQGRLPADWEATWQT